MKRVNFNTAALTVMTHHSRQMRYMLQLLLQHTAATCCSSDCIVYSVYATSCGDG